MQNYMVILRFQYPAHDERGGLVYHARTQTKRDAIRHARTQAARDGRIMSGKGIITFKVYTCTETPPTL